MAYSAGYFFELVRSSSSTAVVEDATGTFVWLRTSDGEPLEQQAFTSSTWSDVSADTGEPDYIGAIGSAGQHTPHRYRKTGEAWLPSDDGVTISEVPWNGGSAVRYGPGYFPGYWAEIVRSTSSGGLSESATGRFAWLRTSDGEPLEQNLDIGTGWDIVSSDTQEPDFLTLATSGQIFRFRKMGEAWIPSDDGIQLSTISWNGASAYRFHSVPDPSVITVLLTTPGAGTWTVPAGVTSIRVELVGGGGGGAGRDSNGSAFPGSAGAATTFDGLNAGGGRGGVSGSAAGGTGTTTNGGAGDDTGPGGTSGASGVQGLSSYGSGGAGARGGGLGRLGGGGGGGYSRVDSHVVTPGESISYVVGAGGGADSRTTASAGQPGAIRITYAAAPAGPAAPNFDDDTGDPVSWTSGEAITAIVVPAATGNPDPTYAVVGSLPTGISFDAATRTISGTPAATGSGTIRIRATNTEGVHDWTVAYSTAAAPPAGVFRQIVGDLGTGSTLRWDPSTGFLIPPALIVNNATAYLLDFSVVNYSAGESDFAELRLGVSSNNSGSSFAAGPELTPMWEGYEEALTVIAGGREILIPGTNHSSNRTRDTSEPYFWSLSSAKGTEWKGFATFYRGLSQAARDATIIELRDRTKRLAIAGRLSIGSVANSSLLVEQPARVALSGRLQIRGTGASRLRVAAPIRLSGRLGIAGTGSSTLNVVNPGVRLSGRLAVQGIGQSGLTVTQPSSVRLSGRLNIGSVGASALDVAQPRFAIAGRLGIVGIGSSQLQVRPPGLFDLPITLLRAVNQYSRLLSGGAADDLSVPSNLLDDGMTAAIDRVQTSATQLRIWMTGRFSSAIETSGVLRFVDPVTGTLIAGIQNFGSTWSNGAYRLTTDTPFLFGTRRALADWVVAHSVGDVLRLRVTPQASIRLSGRLSIPGIGSSTLDVANPPVRLRGRLLIVGTGNSTLRVDQPSAVRLAGRLPIRGIGMSRIAVGQPGRVRIAGRLPISGLGQSTIVVGAPPAAPADRARRDARSLSGEKQRYAIELRHSSLSTPIRLVADTVEHIVEGHRYTVTMFGFDQPQDESGEIRSAALTVDNVGRRLMQLVRDSKGGRGVTIRAMALVPLSGGEVESTISWEVTMLVGSMQVTNRNVEIDLTHSHIFDRPSVLLRHDPATSPGLY